MPPHPDSPAALADRALFEPIAEWLGRFTAAELPDALALTTLLREATTEARTASGQAVHFAATPGAHAYEVHIDATGAVPTRAQDWHDFFNALSWFAWPQTKRALNAAHVREIESRRAAGLAGRGPRRDALTQFDECGLLVVSCDARIPELLAAHDWEAVFVARRTALARMTRFLVVGHASWEALRAPFIGLCGKALHRVVDADWFALDEITQRREADRWLADVIARPEVVANPRALRPLPLLGVPGVTPQSESPAYYRDTRQFRPRRAS